MKSDTRQKKNKGYHNQEKKEVKWSLFVDDMVPNEDNPKDSSKNQWKELSSILTFQDIRMILKHCIFIHKQRKFYN